MAPRSNMDEPWCLLIAKRYPYNTNLGPVSAFPREDYAKNWHYVMWFASFEGVEQNRPEIQNLIELEREDAYENPLAYERKSSLKL